MLALYDELAESLESAAPDCTLMATQMSDVVAERAPELKQALVNTRDAGLNANASLQAEAIKSIARFNEALKRQIPTCSKELMPVMKQLSSMSDN